MGKINSTLSQQVMIWYLGKPFITFNIGVGMGDRECKKYLLQGCGWINTLQ